MKRSMKIGFLSAGPTAANQREPTGNENQRLLVAGGNRTDDQWKGTDDFVSIILVIVLTSIQNPGKSGNLRRAHLANVNNQLNNQNSIFNP